jgi:hypothetical protein
MPLSPVTTISVGFADSYTSVPADEYFYAWTGPLTAHAFEDRSALARAGFDPDRSRKKSLLLLNSS